MYYYSSMETITKKELFLKAFSQGNLLPELIRTPQMRRQVMMSMVAEWLFQLYDAKGITGINESILKIVCETLAEIVEYSNEPKW